MLGRVKKTQEVLAIFMKKKEIYEKKFEKLLNYIEKNKEFPKFNKDRNMATKMHAKAVKIAPFWTKNLCRPNYNYERNIKAFNIIVEKRTEYHHDELMQNYYKYCRGALAYQEENLVLPPRADKFNRNIKLIFKHLDSYI